ncbi:zinc finger protein 239-like isoform X1 [Pieris napi]|uniref:zinc finger protein 239-like isoform X1 n=1 Tax=Pieris napi TaxID=78633 RepID=UPI001FB8B82A|nr:zinc finger protein 239-like isoform X1 [Pieris napi]
MDDICRLCCSNKFVNNYIFDEEKALFSKMSMYLPIKVVKNDPLPKKICDKCSCKVNDFYQFCNETIEVENRLRKMLSLQLAITVPNPVRNTLNLGIETTDYLKNEQSTQAEEDFQIKVKVEPLQSPIVIKQELVSNDDSFDHNGSDSDDNLLIEIKKNKNPKEENERNGHVQSAEKKNHAMLHAEFFDMNLKDSINLEIVKDESDDGFDNMDFDKEVYYCCICFVKCKTKSDMIKHYKGHVDQTQDMKPPAAPPFPAEGRCERCRKVVRNPKAWRTHWQRHWKRDRRPYRCTLCEKSFQGHQQILKHGLIHKPEFENPNQQPSKPIKRFVCDLCPEGFVYMRCLLAHRNSTHPEASSRELALRCALCSRSFTHLNSLRRHLRSHSGDRNYLCNVCGKSLTSREHLKFHIRIHTGYKPNVCKTCGKGFVKKCNLTLHERVHSGEKPYVCSHCGKAFSQRSTLVIHERYHSGARPYKCAVCGRGFVAKGLLSMHLKTSCVDLPAPTGREMHSPKVERVDPRLLEH